MNQRNVELHICGTGNDDAVNEMKTYGRNLWNSLEMPLAWECVS